MTTSRIGRWAALLALGALLAACGDDAGKTSVITVTVTDPIDTTSKVLNDDNFADYKAKIGPQDFDHAWQQIDWLTSYRTGLEVASRQKKPILLWVMNGHPLGCT